MRQQQETHHLGGEGPRAGFQPETGQVEEPEKTVVTSAARIGPCGPAAGRRGPGPTASSARLLNTTMATRAAGTR